LPSFMAQPPLPLQEFLPAQPASPLLQPPLPLQPFLPAQSWVSPLSFFSSARVPATVVAFLNWTGPLTAAWDLAANPPVTMPASAAPARSAFVVLMRFIVCCCGFVFLFFW